MRLVWGARAGVFALFFALVVLVVYLGFYRHAPAELPELTSTLFGTVLAGVITVASGIGLFYFQQRETDNETSLRLLKAVAAEVLTVLDVLNGPPNTIIRDPQRGNAGIPVRLGQFEPVATEEAIRTSLFIPQSIFNLTQLANLMREYKQVSNGFAPFLPYIYAQRLPLEMWEPAYGLARELERVRLNLLEACEAVVESLEAVGIDLPPDRKHRSDPSRVRAYRPEAPPSEHR